MERLMNAGHNVLLAGESGAGKTAIVSAFLRDTVAKGKTVSSTISYSAHTGSERIRDLLETTLVKERQNLLCPPSGKRMYLFVDDLNIPSFDTHGAQRPNEMLRQVLDGGGFYDSKKRFFKAVRGVVCVAACAPSGDKTIQARPVMPYIPLLSPPLTVKCYPV